MTEVVFDVDYKSAYTTTIEFKTQINEKHFGKEQRYPVWTYPKRTFSLSFDKSFEGRKKLEDFYQQTKGGTEKFLFSWAKDKGGNGKQYLCTLDDDSFKQNLYEFGFYTIVFTVAAEICRLRWQPWLLNLRLQRPGGRLGRPHRLLRKHPECW